MLARASYAAAAADHLHHHSDQISNSSQDTGAATKAGKHKTNQQTSRGAYRAHVRAVRGTYSGYFHFHQVLSAG